MIVTPGPALVRVPVTVLWRSPDSPREVDAAVLTAEPSHSTWLSAMDAPGLPQDDSRFGLLGRIDSQVVLHEPLIVLESDHQWSKVVAPWQPSSLDERGYPGWVRTSHLTSMAEPTAPAPAGGETDARSLLVTARDFLGTAYLWGGVSETAVDCSGLVHFACRAHGVTVPRDATDQQTYCTPVPQGSERPGDLYFFAEPEAPVHHVGFVTEPGIMLHAPGTGSDVVVESMPPDRQKTLVSVGRIPGVREV